ncbi:sensor histidine kinase [Nonomuraea sp. MG754425]|uniref:sensor histidine kinase n=1 Tax=Nonomuraea sp. MG754425 TaxID=2570319 RepID=UPI001F0086B2|nr:histidine kinase [Nonomuraea sp. MG754425]MCF6471040.1 sensor histidine kinase [Nonomuraea sp. MG754425]
MRAARTLMTIVRFFRRPAVFDRTLVIVLAVPAAGAITLLVLAREYDGVWSPVHYLLGVLALLVRRRRPVAALGLLAVVDAVFLLTHAVSYVNLPTFIALYSVGRQGGDRGRAPAGVAALFSVGVPVGVGQLVRLRAELGERGRREAADAAVRAERRRIARELHDVVAHHITVINALVGGARATLPPGQAVTRDALESAEQTARQAMSEMRRLLDVLRADGNEGPDAATGVGADRLPALIREAGSAGLPATLTVTGAAVELPAAVDHAVYRIVQEALTNTRKHAAGARASVRLAYGAAAVEVEVLDDGVAKNGGAPGFGLGGMAERVALCGGRLSTGPRPEGGFRVHARIPLEQR